MCELYRNCELCIPNDQGEQVVTEVHRDHTDRVNHPPHYKDRVPNIEAIEVTEHFNFNIGNAIKYLWRHGLKGDPIEDLRKAAWYVNREIERLSREA